MYFSPDKPQPRLNLGETSCGWRRPCSHAEWPSWKPRLQTFPRKCHLLVLPATLVISPSRCPRLTFPFSLPFSNLKTILSVLSTNDSSSLTEMRQAIGRDYLKSPITKSGHLPTSGPICSPSLLLAEMNCPCSQLKPAFPRAVHLIFSCSRLGSCNWPLITPASSISPWIIFIILQIQYNIFHLWEKESCDSISYSPVSLFPFTAKEVCRHHFYFLPSISLRTHSSQNSIPTSSPKPRPPVTFVLLILMIGSQPWPKRGFLTALDATNHSLPVLGFFFF